MDQGKNFSSSFFYAHWYRNWNSSICWKRIMMFPNYFKTAEWENIDENCVDTVHSETWILFWSREIDEIFHDKHTVFPSLELCLCSFFFDLSGTLMTWPGKMTEDVRVLFKIASSEGVESNLAATEARVSNGSTWTHKNNKKIKWPIQIRLIG